MRRHPRAVILVATRVTNRGVLAAQLLQVAWNARAANWQWEVNLLASPQVNAFCMPGGKIAFYFGILQQLQLDDDEVAMIMGHEVAHALLEHARERMAKDMGTNLLLRGGAALLGLGGLGDTVAQMGSQLLSLKFSRSDELEARVTEAHARRDVLVAELAEIRQRSLLRRIFPPRARSDRE